MAYIARCPGCGKVPAAVMIGCPDAAAEVSRWIRDGLRIEQADVDAVRVMFSECECSRPQKATDQMTLETTDD